MSNQKLEEKKRDEVTVASPQNSSQQPSIESYRLAELSVIEELNGERGNQSLKQCWINLANQLEIDGIPKEKISTVGKKIIIEKKRERLRKTGSYTEDELNEVTVSGWYRDVMREVGCTDSKYSPHPTKNDDDNDVESKPKGPYEEENCESIDVIDEMLDYLRSEKQFLKHYPHDKKIPKNILRENILVMRQAVTHANERFNNKLKIAPSHYSILFRDFLESMSSHLSVPYYLHVREKEKFTAKQAGKIIRANIKDMPYRYEPKNEDESEACGFSGVVCPKCGNFRTEITMRIEQYVDEKGKTRSRGIRQIHCFKEDKDYDAPKVRLPASEISDASW